MVKIKPFRGLRPTPEYASSVASPPYDVLSSKEAREMARTNPHSFLHVVKPEIDLPPNTDPYADAVYLKAAENLMRMRKENVLKQDDSDCHYLYQIQMGDHVQTGLVAVASVDDYLENRIKKHEFTRPVKEDDRTKHILVSKAQAGPVFLINKSDAELTSIFEETLRTQPEVNFVADDGIRHSLWVIRASDTIERITALFVGFDAIYVADGHHRSAAGSRVAKLMREKNPDYNGDESYNYFLTVIFPDDQMKIMAYNRVVKDLRDMSDEQFLSEIEKRFSVAEVSSKAEAEPSRRYDYGMYMNGTWYRLTADADSIDKSDPVESLDIQVLTRTVLEPLLGIEDPRTDPRINFVGGIRGLLELEKLVDSGDWKVAFALHPTTVRQLLDVADADRVMPPKSTWFEPKLRSGMVVHLIE
jgi:uncharacterized protein (DUF1015 family)